MKALLLCQNLNVGGAEELVLGASTHLRAVGVNAGVVAITQRGPIAEEIARAGVPVHDAPGQPGPRDTVAFIRLVRLLRREAPDVVHTYLLNANLYGRLAALAAGVPVVLASEQNVYADKSRRHVVIERLLAPATYRVVACCRAVGDSYQRQVGVDPDKIAVVYNGVRFGPAPGPENRAPALTRLSLDPGMLVLGTLGRLTEQKGQVVLLQALARLAPRFPRLHLMIAGQGPLRGTLEAVAARLGVGDRVHFVGMRRDRATLYAATDLFILPSRWEGLSLALIEAMGAGRPIVATAVGGNPEVITHGQTGLLVPPDGPAGLADGIESLLVGTELRAALGSQAAITARARFSIERHVSEIAALYRAGLAERAGAAAAPTRVGS